MQIYKIETTITTAGSDKIVVKKGGCMDDRHRVEVKTVITNSEDKETAGASIFLGEMKLEDVKATEKVLLEGIPRLFLGLLR